MLPRIHPPASEIRTVRVRPRAPIYSPILSPAKSTSTLILPTRPLESSATPSWVCVNSRLHPRCKTTIWSAFHSQRAHITVIVCPLLAWPFVRAPPRWTDIAVAVRLASCNVSRAKNAMGPSGWVTTMWIYSLYILVTAARLPSRTEKAHYWIPCCYSVGSRNLEECVLLQCVGTWFEYRFGVLLRRSMCFYMHKVPYFVTLTMREVRVHFPKNHQKISRC